MRAFPSAQVSWQTRHSAQNSQLGFPLSSVREGYSAQTRSGQQRGWWGAVMGKTGECETQIHQRRATPKIAFPVILLLKVTSFDIAWQLQISIIFWPLTQIWDSPSWMIWKSRMLFLKGFLLHLIFSWLFFLTCQHAFLSLNYRFKWQVNLFSIYANNRKEQTILKTLISNLWFISQKLASIFG